MNAICATLPYKNYRFSGDDTLTFLQGQLTQDISLIKVNTCQYGAFCDVKGRMLANFLLFRDNEGYILRLHEGLADRVIKRLKMFVLRSKVAVSPTENAPIGLNHQGAQQLCEQMGLGLPETFTTVGNESFTLCALPNDYYELYPLGEPKEGEVALESLTTDVDAIETLRLSGGHFNVLPETNESIAPQQTPLEAWGGINYKKGCYVGQEIIARNKYRGKVSKAMGYALLERSIDVGPNDNIVIDGKKNIGKIIESHRNADSTACLAIMSIESLGKPVIVGDCETTFQAIA